jgi:hypothetical protein
MTTPGEWLEWEALWRTDRATPAALEAMIERTRRARRALWLLRCLSTALAAVALGVVGAALRHAANRFEAGLGLVVGVGIVAVWLIDVINQRRAIDKVDAPAEEYVAMRRALCIRQARFATLGWIVTALDLVFLVPWWIGGIAVHGGGFHPSQLLTMWGPLAIMGGFVWWTIRLRRRARIELARLPLERPGDA